jgi:hypothetical protein
VDEAASDGEAAAGADVAVGVEDAAGASLGLSAGTVAVAELVWSGTAGAVVGGAEAVATPEGVEAADGFADGVLGCPLECADGLVVGRALPPPPLWPLPPPLPPESGVAAGVGLGDAACGVAGTPGPERDPLCQAKAT